MLSTQSIGVLSTKRGGVRSSRTAKAADEKTGWPKANGIFRGGLSSVASVSYTHLDVYKRQIHPIMRA